MSREVMQMALEALESDPVSHLGLVNRKQALAALRQALETEQQPVAWMYVNSDGECEQIEYGRPFDDPSVTPLYTAPPKQWVGLTDFEIEDIYFDKFSMSELVGFARSIEQALKEKNKL